jgi:hypothetical protein
MIEGQLSSAERRHIARALKEAEPKPKVCLEVGAWLGGGSTRHRLRALEKNRAGHICGVEADRTIYERMLCNIASAFPDGAKRFSQLFGFSQAVIPEWLKPLSPDETVDFVFLDGAANSREPLIEFHLLNSRMTVGSQSMSHDARRRTGKWLVPCVSLLDNWQSSLIPKSEYGRAPGTPDQDAAQCPQPYSGRTVFVAPAPASGRNCGACVAARRSVVDRPVVATDAERVPSERRAFGEEG